MKRRILRAGAIAGISLFCIASSANVFTEKRTTFVAEASMDMHLEKIPSVSIILSEVPKVSAAFELGVAEDSPSQNMIISMNWSAEDRYLLANIAMAEAEGEDTEGKALVILVVLNRVFSNKFPDSIKEVIYQPGQFKPIDNGRFDRVEPDADCWAALNLVMLDEWDGSRGTTYFESESESTWHSENLDFVFQHGKHKFYKEKE